MEGKIKYLSGNGFGFITVEGREKDLFFHAKEVRNVTFLDLNVGDEVTFENIEDTPKGSTAVGVLLKA